MIRLPRLPKILGEISKEIRYELWGLLFVALGTIGILGLVGLNTGSVGAIIAKMSRYAFGIGALAVPLLVLIIGLRYIWKRSAIGYTLKFWSFVILFINLLTLYHHWRIPMNQEILPESLLQGGGFVSGMILFVLRKFLGEYGTFVLLIVAVIMSLMISTTWSLAKTLLIAKKKAWQGFQSAKEKVAVTMEDFQEQHEQQQINKREFFDQDKVTSAKTAGAEEQHFTIQTYDPGRATPSKEVINNPQVNEIVPAKADVPLATATAMSRPAAYVLPSFNLLNQPVKVDSTQIKQEILDNAHVLEKTFESFNVKAKIVHTCQGPAVTRYEIEPAAGVKVSRIVNLSDDLALKLAAPGIRIEAPIPGKAAIGIEVPNKNVSMVPHREALECQDFLNAKSKLTVALGKDIAGQTILADLAKMPHLLVAGATGSGKSVCINTLITSILFKARPEEVKFILVDPKVVELSTYNGIPHLLTPVVTDAKKAASALRWAVQEMERRYGLFATQGVRDITRYNEMVQDDKLPYVVIIIDELADLMMVAPVDVEDAVCRLAQMARAAGLHLVIATQRPSVDVITGIIKANVPSRISFAVSSQIDSRTILDMAGAEKLLGKGDMLFYPVGAAKPLRVQGSFISDQEVEKLVQFIKQQEEPQYTEEVTAVELQSDSKSSSSEFEDELLPEAIRLVLENGQASSSMLQRKFRIGYTRAARLIDMMEDMKIVGPNLGSKAREIIMTSDEVQRRYFNDPTE